MVPKSQKALSRELAPTVAKKSRTAIHIEYVKKKTIYHLGLGRKLSFDLGKTFKKCLTIYELQQLKTWFSGQQRTQYVWLCCRESTMWLIYNHTGCIGKQRLEQGDSSWCTSHHDSSWQFTCQPFYCFPLSMLVFSVDCSHNRHVLSETVP